MLAELHERDATGAIARIYHEIREYCGVPYVSSLQRHLATRPRWLEWSWSAVRPAFVSGAAQQTAWAAAAAVDAVPLPRLSPPALRLLGVDADGRQAIGHVCETFIRAAPTNLMLSGLLRMLLDGQRPDARSAADRAHPSAPAWQPPAALPPLPSLATRETVSPETWAVLMQLGTSVAGEPFVPGLYRMLGHWPGYLAHLATELGPRFDDPATRASCADVLGRIDAQVGGVFAALPALAPAPAPPPRSEFGDVLAALDTYRRTSPEMIVFATLIRDALPDA